MIRYLLIALFLIGCTSTFPPPSRPDKLMCEMKLGKNILCRTYCIKLSDGSEWEIVEILRNFNGRIIKTETKKRECSPCGYEGKDLDCYIYFK